MTNDDIYIVGYMLYNVYVCEEHVKCRGYDNMSGYIVW